MATSIGRGSFTSVHSLRRRLDWEDWFLEPDNDSAIASQRTSLELISDGDPQKSSYLFELAGLYKDRFDRKDRTFDLNNAITNQKAGLELLPDGDPQKPPRIFELAGLYKQRFDRKTRTSDLNNVIANQKTGLELISDDDPKKPLHLFELASLYEQRFDRKDRLGDLDSAVGTKKAGLELLPGDNSQKPIHLFELANLYKRRFDRSYQVLDLDNAIANQKVALELLSENNPQKQYYFFELLGLYEQRFDKGDRTLGLDNAIEDQKAELGLLSESDPRRQTHLFGLVNLYEQRFDWEDQILDLDGAIANQEAGVGLLSWNDPQKPIHLFKLANMYERRFDREYQALDLDNAIANQKVGLKLLPSGSSQKPTHLFHLANLYERLFDQKSQDLDLDNAVANQKAGLELLTDNDPQKPIGLFKLSSLYERCLERGHRTLDLNDALANQRAGLHLLSDGDPQKPTHLFKLASLYKRRFDWGDQARVPDKPITEDQEAKLEFLPDGEPEKPLWLTALSNWSFDWDCQVLDLDNAIASQKAGLDLLPDSDPNESNYIEELIHMRARRSKLAEECLLRDLQQLGVYIKNPRLEVEIGVITHAITILNDSDSDKLCHEIRAISVRLRGYCEALRSQVGGTMDRGSLQVLFREIVMIEREVSAAHENLTARYERIYKIWRTRREQISNMLTLLDSVGSMKPQSYIKGLHVLIQQVDDSLESIRRMLNDQEETLKRYFNACKVLVAFISPKGNPPSGPVPPDNSGLSICNPDSLLSPPPGLTKAIEVGKERLSQIDAVVGKARYTKARKAVEANISTTASQLESLHRNSQEYEWKFRGLPLSKPFHGIKLWNRWREPSRQLPNLVGIMTDALVKIQRGFDGYKESIVELIFRPLGNMTKDLKPYLSQIAQDIVGKRLHPDMILYEAAFLFLIKHVSQQFGLTEQVYDCRSRLETMLRKN